MPRPPLTVVVPCKDEEANLIPCVTSALGWADEILIADSGSSDGTLKLAQQLCSHHPEIRVVQKEFINYGNFKGWASSQARHDWVFVLDADERLTEGLKCEIDEALSDADRPDAFAVRFTSFFLGYPIRHGNWGRHAVVRLFKKSVCHFNSRTVHESVVTSSRRVGVLRNRVDHYTCQSLDKWFHKKTTYARLGAEDLARRGRNTHWWDFCLRPLADFVTSYVFHLGFLDGFAGFLTALDEANSVFFKYLQLWQIQGSRTAAPRTASSAALPGPNSVASPDSSRDHPLQAKEAAA